MKVGELAYTDLLGLPLVAWGGMVTLALLLLTFSIGYLNHKGVRIIPFKHHKPAAAITLIFGVIHGLMGLLANLGY